MGDMESELAISYSQSSQWQDWVGFDWAVGRKCPVETPKQPSLMPGQRTPLCKWDNIHIALWRWKGWAHASMEPSSRHSSLWWWKVLCKLLKDKCGNQLSHTTFHLQSVLSARDAVAMLAPKFWEWPSMSDLTWVPLHERDSMAYTARMAHNQRLYSLAIYFFEMIQVTLSVETILMT